MLGEPYKNGYTELHFKARYGSPYDVLDLLRKGETLACKNDHGTLPVGDIHVGILQTHLDECIIPDFEYEAFHNRHPNDIIRETVDVTINYHTLLPKRRLSNDSKTPEKIEPDKKKIVGELDVIDYISNEKGFKHLLKHPTIKSFVDIKWVQYRWLLYLNVMHSALLCLFLILNSTNSAFSKKILLFFITTATLIEVIDFVLSPREYVVTIKNYADLFLIAATTYIVVEEITDERKKLITGTAILLSALESLLFLGLFPKFSKYALMLLEVAKSFFKFFCYYFIFVLAFAFCFYSLFKSRSKQIEGDMKEPQKTNGFDTIALAIYKTLIMLTGEFNSNDIVYEPYPIASRIILILYIFMIAIILMNLLNGLAVSDIQKIENDAELLAITAKVNYMVHINKYYNVQNFFAKVLVFLNCLLPNIIWGKLYRNSVYTLTLRLNYNEKDKGSIVRINDEDLVGEKAYITSGNTMKQLQEVIKKKRLQRFFSNEIRSSLEL